MLKCIESTEEALAALSGGRGVMPLRSVLTLPLGGGQTGLLGMMPSYMPGKQAPTSFENCDSPAHTAPEIWLG